MYQYSAPKCLVQGLGVLLNHWKELVLHSNISNRDVVFYFTTTGWMMWNWLTSCLFIGATIVLYEGNPLYPAPDSLFEMAANEKISVFGTSAKYLQTLAENKVSPRIKKYDLSQLRMILSTGSPASENVFKYVYEEIKNNIQFSSIAGGTDICGCFFLGHPNLPVRLSELQCIGLGMKVNVYNEEGQQCNIDEPGELICEAPSPNMPLYFLNDDVSGSKYLASYFDKFKGVWCHGDFVEIKKSGGAIIHGRSDATLKPGGVRIGTAEIYRVIERIPEIKDSVIIGQNYKDDIRVVLFVVMVNPNSLNDEFIKTIQGKIRKETSPRHVPDVILECSDIPYTVSNKKVEIAIKKIIMGEEIKNVGALRNPEALKWFYEVGKSKLST